MGSTPPIPRSDSGKFADPGPVRHRIRDRPWDPWRSHRPHPCRASDQRTHAAWPWPEGFESCVGPGRGFVPEWRLHRGPRPSGAPRPGVNPTIPEPDVPRLNGCPGVPPSPDRGSAGRSSPPAPTASPSLPERPRAGTRGPRSGAATQHPGGAGKPAQPTARRSPASGG